MPAIPGKESASGSTPAAADHAVRKGFIRRSRKFTDEYLVTVQALFWIVALKNKILTIITEIGLRIVAVKCQLPDIPEMFFIRV